MVTSILSLDRGRGQVSPVAAETMSLIIRFPAGITEEWGFMAGSVALNVCMRIFFLAGKCPVTWTLASPFFSGCQCCLFLLGRADLLI